MRSGSLVIGKRMRRPVKFATAAFAACLIATLGAALSGAPSANARAVKSSSAAAIFPKFSTPKRLYVADMTGLSGEDQLTAVTLQGVYNGDQQPGRLYVTESANDTILLSHVPSSIPQVTIPTPSSGSLLQALLQKFRSSIKGAIVTDPSNVDTVNLATTLAGIDHAIVIHPDQESMIASLGIPVRYNFDTDAFTADTPEQTYEWAIQKLLPKTTTKLNVEMSGTLSGYLRDYAVATKAFVYYLTPTKTDEVPLLSTVLHHDPVNTPVMGYTPNENPDVAYMSQQGYFLTGSQTTTNLSAWSAMPSPPSMHQKTEAAPLAAKPGTVYVGIVRSDGDSLDFDTQFPAYWSKPDMGSVPVGWTISPAMLSMDPAILQYIYKNVPSDSELLTGPSGFGYTTQEDGANMTQFGALTQQLGSQLDLHTVDTYQPVDTLGQYSSNAGGPEFISKDAPLLYAKSGNTVTYGQTSWYDAGIPSLICTVAQQAATEQSTDKPLFLQPMVRVNYSPDQVLNLAQTIATEAKASGLKVVFTTPTELALTMERYYSHRESRLPAANVQSMTGDQVLAEPQPSAPILVNPVTVTGSNLVTNPSGASGAGGWTTAGGIQSLGNAPGGSVTATTYQDQPALQWANDAMDQQSWVQYYPDVTAGDTYTFSADVAGSGQVYMDVYSGGWDQTTLPVKLASHYQKFTWTKTIPANSPTGQTGNAPHLEIREAGASPVSVYIKSASVAQSTPAC